MKRAEIVVIASPGIGPLVAVAELAKLLINRDERLSVTVLVIKLPNDSKTIPKSDSDRIRFNQLSSPSPFPSHTHTHTHTHDSNLDSELSSNSRPKSAMQFLSALIHAHKTNVRDVVADIIRSHSVSLAGFIIDMFCTTMIDVANEFGVPTYAFYTSGASLLGLIFHFQSLQDHQNQDITHEFNNSDAELFVPTFTNPVPVKVLPAVMVFEKSDCTLFLSIARRLRETKGILVNTFMELESHAMKSLSLSSDCDGIGHTPPAPAPVYPVGPIIDIKGTGATHNRQQYDAIMSWLDDQPPSSVVFLCFGSMGSFDDDQVKEIAHALERSGYRFLWSLRQPPPKDKLATPQDYSNLEEVLPEGFLERTVGEGKGKMIGWAPQMAVLSHPAVGGFVSHCGWNSTLESIWCGVPVATWPLFAEQQINAFQMVREMGLAVEIKLDYRRDFYGRRGDMGMRVVTAAEIESGIRQVMMGDGEIRKKMKEMKEKSRVTMMEGGSSYTCLGRIIEDLVLHSNSTCTSATIN